jgi:hypothetical protein
VSGTGYFVDFDALERAAAGVDGILQQLSTQPLNTIPHDVAVIGHPALSTALADFTTGWQQGVDNLVTEGESIAGRLRANVAAYRTVEDHLVRVCGGLVGVGTDPGVR